MNKAIKKTLICGIICAFSSACANSTLSASAGFATVGAVTAVAGIGIAGSAGSRGDLDGASTGVTVSATGGALLSVALICGIVGAIQEANKPRAIEKLHDDAADTYSRRFYTEKKPIAPRFIERRKVAALDAARCVQCVSGADGAIQCAPCAQ